VKPYLEHSDLVRGAPVDCEKVGKVSAESVRRHTGKDWAQWIGLLDKAGARSWTYQELVAFLKAKHRLTPWWQMGVATGFEIAIGRRAEGQDAKGNYMVTATKSLAFSVQQVWSFVVSPEGQAVWLRPLSEIELKPKAQFETRDGFFGEVRTVARNHRARLFWQDPLWDRHTVVEILLVPKPGKKSILVFNHTGIKELRTKGLLSARWREAADQIKESLSGRP
jgi:uncharacterized protein YndB with AHSA1/START domain